MQVLVRFTFSCDDENVINTNAELKKIKNILKGKEIKEKWIGDDIYELDQDSILYKKTLEYVKKNADKRVEFILFGYIIKKITEEEWERAVAFILQFPDYYCEEYEDISNEYDECDICYSKKKTDVVFYAQLKGYIKKHKDECGIAGFDGTGELLLLPKLVKKMQDEGIDKRYFQPVISKRKKILGYIFVTDNILPRQSYIDENYKFKNRCQKCGRIIMEEDENLFQYQQKYITTKGMHKLKDVNLTYEFLDEFQETIISKKVAKIIKENVPYAELSPVFLSDN